MHFNILCIVFAGPVLAPRISIGAYKNQGQESSNGSQITVFWKVNVQNFTNTIGNLT